MRLRAQLLAALCASALQNITTVRSRHTLAEPMNLAALSLFGLIGTYHILHLFLPNIVMAHNAKLTLPIIEEPSPKCQGLFFMSARTIHDGVCRQFMCKAQFMTAGQFMTPFAASIHARSTIHAVRQFTRRRRNSSGLSRTTASRILNRLFLTGRRGLSIPLRFITQEDRALPARTIDPYDPFRFIT